MGGVLLLMALIGVFIVCFWYIFIEEAKNKTIGFLGFIKDAAFNIHIQEIKKKSFRSKKASNATLSSHDISQKMDGRQEISEQRVPGKIVSKTTFRKPKK